MKGKAGYLGPQQGGRTRFYLSTETRAVIDLAFLRSNIR
jgi:hypothetical protein